MDQFKTDPSCESLAKAVYDALWRQRYACRMCFYEAREANDHTFCDRVISDQPDSIVWLTPTPRITLLGQRLMNCGVRVTRVSDGMEVTDILSELLS
jgi:hypothetical protein